MNNTQAYLNTDIDNFKLIKIKQEPVRDINGKEINHYYQIEKYNGTGKDCVTIPYADKNKTAPITKIGADAFRECKGIKKIIIPHSINDIGESAFEECINLEEVEIGGFGYYGKSMNNFTNTIIGHSAFMKCKSLRIVKIGLVSRIRCNVFDCCPNLREIVIEDTIPPVLECKDIFKVLDINNCMIYNQNLKIKVPSDKIADYQEYWKDFINKDSIVSNGNIACY